MLRGAIARLFPERAQGYLVRPYMGAAEILFHARDLDGSTLEQLHVGQVVEFELASDPRGIRAVQIRTVEG
jgi:cold shock CspA family protein